MLEKLVWAGANLSSYAQATAAIEVLAGLSVTAKQVRRITTQAGDDRLQERREQVAAFQSLPLVERTSPHPTADPPELGVVMPDGGRMQRRDLFAPRGSSKQKSRAKPKSAGDKTSHWREDKVGVVLAMRSDVFEQDPCPDFPDWLAGASVVAEIAQLAAREENDAEASELPAVEASLDEPALEESSATNWPGGPELLRRDVVASMEDSESFGWHLEWEAWRGGITAAPRQAFVADGAAVNWTIHRQHFSQMTGVLDLMHALSYAWRAARPLDAGAYRRFAEAIWQGRVDAVIAELAERLDTTPENPESGAAWQRAHTYFTNHRERMKYPEYRKQGLPLTSSHIESTIKQINVRMKGTEKFWRRDNADALLQLRSDCLSDSAPLDAFWTRWRTRQTGANRYRAAV
ncbi:MAG TPA: hypothetical protein VG734_27235 [Lacunisphaera sp.]|nr:hypothetical protein [Lacunisphaera sp.]